MMTAVLRLLRFALVAIIQWLAGIIVIGGLAVVVICYGVYRLCRNLPGTIDGVFGRLARFKSPMSIRELVDGNFRPSST
jgi:hypothetical protein